MSMINDALRRASDAAKSAAGGHASLPPLPIAPPPLPAPASTFSAPLPADAYQNSSTTESEFEESENKSPLKTIIVVLIVFLSIGGVAGFKYWKKKQAAKFAELVISATKPVAGEIKTPPKSSPNSSPSVANSPVPPTPSAPPATVTSTAPAPAVAAAPVKFPLLRLQSIFYRPSSPSVMINGKTLFITDEIQGVTIADISPASVTLVLSGQTNVLTLR